MEKIKSLPNKTFFKRKAGAKKTYMKGAYCRTNKAYECENFDDISDFIYLKPSKEVFTDFEF